MYNNDDDGWTNPLFVAPFDVPEVEEIDTKAYNIICPHCGAVVDGFLDSGIEDRVKSGKTKSIKCPVGCCKRRFDVEYDAETELFETNF